MIGRYRNNNVRKGGEGTPISLLILFRVSTRHFVLCNIRHRSVQWSSVSPRDSERQPEKNYYIITLYWNWTSEKPFDEFGNVVNGNFDGRHGDGVKIRSKGVNIIRQIFVF